VSYLNCVRAILAGALCIGCGEGGLSSESSLIDLNNQPAEPFGISASPCLVFVFTRTDCPISNRYAPEIQRLYDRFSPKGVEFLLIYPDPNESTEGVRKHRQEYGYPCAALRDPHHELVRRTGVRVTPEAAVFVRSATSGHRMVYRGRIDDRYTDFGKARPSPAKRDLEEALEAVLKGGAVECTTTTAVGCFISDLK